MIGTGLRKLAAEKGMKVAKGVAYGSLGGYCATLSEGSGFKTLAFATRFPDASQRHAFVEFLRSQGLDNEFKLRTLDAQEKVVNVVFVDTVGTMKRIEGFIDRVIPLLEQYGASKMDVCPECGMILTGGSWKLVNGIAVYIHGACGERLKSLVQTENDDRLCKGSYLSGAAGAFLGALGGGVVWALIMLLGYISAWIGLLIGFLAEKCYTLFKGKKGVGKVIILIFAVIFGVLVGNVGSEIIAIIREFGCGVKDSFLILLAATAEIPDVRSTLIKNIALGLLFAGLGVVGLLVNTKHEVTGAKFIDLE